MRQAGYGKEGKYVLYGLNIMTAYIEFRVEMKTFRT